MNAKLLFIVGICMCLSSCKSEYEERLDKAKTLKSKLLKIQEKQHQLGISTSQEVNEIITEIQFHARISGNEDLFLKELQLD